MGKTRLCLRSFFFSETKIMFKPPQRASQTTIFDSGTACHSMLNI